ncbi:hypothetical protein PFLUV_G00102440 [Perca fluviatilis]|uniref:C2 domain-containing protein n=1 Tax=Perca fluviatilis TaxID=8168 RepID=A0A6A5F5X7_PERFL|nr:hypothetical protein PFLUV_G00102440 [Perca fluviatilis]
MPATASGNVVPITAGLPGLGLKELGPMSQSIRQESSPWAWVDMTSYRASSLVFPAEIIAELDSHNVDLGELMFSLCYLPTAGRLTITMIKARNLKAMDITGASDPYVKVSLMCEGRRLKKRKTSTMRNTLNPLYNEAIVFDVPPENINQISLLIAVMDYDRVGHNEVIGVCRVGNEAESLGRDHWNEMLTYPRKPIAHWHPLMEVWASYYY